MSKARYLIEQSSFLLEGDVIDFRSRKKITKPVAKKSVKRDQLSIFDLPEQPPKVVAPKPKPKMPEPRNYSVQEFNKTKLKNMIKKGLLLGRLTYSYGKSPNQLDDRFLPTQLDKPNGHSRVVDGKLVVNPDDFVGRGRYAHVESDRPDTLQAGNYQVISFEFKRKDKKPFMDQPKSISLDDIGEYGLYVLYIHHKYTPMYRHKYLKKIHGEVLDNMIKKGLVDQGLLTKSGAVTNKGRSVFSDNPREKLKKYIEEIGQTMNPDFSYS
jgi:hypothetical protein